MTRKVDVILIKNIENMFKSTANWFNMWTIFAFYLIIKFVFLKIQVEKCSEFPCSDTLNTPKQQLELVVNNLLSVSALLLRFKD